MTRQQILDKIAEFEAVLAKGEQAVAHIVQWAWSHLHAGGQIGSIVTGDVRTKITNLHTNAQNRLMAAMASKEAAEATPAPKAPPPPQSTGTLPAPSQAPPSPDPNDKP